MWLKDVCIAIVQDTKKAIRRKPTWQNMWFAVSLGAFLLSNIRFSSIHFLAYGCAAVTGLLFALWLPPLLAWLNTLPKTLKWVAFVSALGAVEGNISAFIYRLAESDKTVQLFLGLPAALWAPLLWSFAVVVAVFGVWSMMVGCCFVYQKLLSPIREVWNRSSRIERVTVVVCVIGLSMLSWWSFAHTKVFYAESFDVIYTADSAIQEGRNAFLWLRHPENDLRQPLFALAAIPFFGAVTFLTMPFVMVCPYVEALGGSVVQILLIVGGFLLLTQLLRLRCGGERASVLMLLCGGYSTMLFCVQPEQYAVGVFWLLLFFVSGRHGVRGFSRLRKETFLFTVWSLVTNGIACLAVLPWWRKSAWKGCVLWLMNVGVKFATLFFLTMGALLLSKLSDRIEMYQKFAGRTVALADRLMQWLAFAAMSVCPPDADLVTTAKGVARWSLASSPAWGFYLGWAVLLGCLVALIFCWKRYAMRLCAGWVCFSFLLLCLIGWGTAENGLILYTLLFAWAFIGMLVLGVKELCERWCPKLFIPLIWVCAGVMLSFSLPEFLRMVRALSAVW